MRNQSYGAHDSMQIVDNRIFITRAAALAGARRWVRYHASDGRECSLPVDIPPGVTTGTLVSVTVDAADHDIISFGNPAVMIIVVPHHISECRGSDVYLTLWVDRAMALRERQIELQIGNGRVIAVPLESTESRGHFLYRGQGLLRGYAPHRYGDLIVRLEILDVDEPAEEQPALAVPAPPNWWQALFGSGG